MRSSTWQVIALAFVTAAAWLWMALNQWQPPQWARDYCRTRVGVAWEVSEFLDTIVMWLIMMVAMMTPTVLPWVRALQAKESPHSAGQSFPSLAPWFVLGYLAAWSLFSVLASVVQWQLASHSLLMPAQWIGNQRLFALILLALGFYQWTPLKNTCLKHCESPASYFLTHWHDGYAGAMRMGFQHGLYCVGCCWLLMLFTRVHQLVT